MTAALHHGLDMKRSLRATPLPEAVAYLCELLEPEFRNMLCAIRQPQDQLPTRTTPCCVRFPDIVVLIFIFIVLQVAPSRRFRFFNAIDRYT